MIAFNAWTVLLVFLSLSSHEIRAQEGSTCTLPNSSTQSTCIRIHYCDSLWEAIKRFGRNPPVDEMARIDRHKCEGSYYCCPDNAVAAAATVTPIVSTPVAATNSIAAFAGMPPKSDLNEVKFHKNFNLINDKCGSSTSNRIINGKLAALGEFPWMALLQFKSRLGDSLTFSCGGALITNSYVLTAAHCINRDLVAVRLGEHTISTEKDCNADGICADPVQDIPVANTIRHPQYNSAKKINDIGLLKLQSPADTTKKFVKTICLPVEAANQIDKIDVQAREKMTITGWGKIESGVASDELLRAYVPYLPNNECAARFAADRINIYETYLCAGGRSGTKKTDTCSGDSGGPIQSFGSVNNKQKMILYGVVSVGVKCLDEGVNYPGIYTNVAHYLTWILDNIS